jgi:hypothetical protein
MLALNIHETFHSVSYLILWDYYAYKWNMIIKQCVWFFYYFFLHTHQLQWNWISKSHNAFRLISRYPYIEHFATYLLLKPKGSSCPMIMYDNVWKHEFVLLLGFCSTKIMYYWQIANFLSLYHVIVKHVINLLMPHSRFHQVH